jgi:hypothetical protein
LVAVTWPTKNKGTSQQLSLNNGLQLAQLPGGAVVLGYGIIAHFLIGIAAIPLVNLPRAVNLAQQVVHSGVGAAEQVNDLVVGLLAGLVNTVWRVLSMSAGGAIAPSSAPSASRRPGCQPERRHSPLARR